MGPCSRASRSSELRLTMRAEGLRPFDKSADGSKGPFLPQWLGVDFQVRDVELEKALAHFDANATGGPREVPVSGRLNLEGSAGSRWVRSTT